MALIASWSIPPIDHGSGRRVTPYSGRLDRIMIRVCGVHMHVALRERDHNAVLAKRLIDRHVQMMENRGPGVVRHLRHKDADLKIKGAVTKP